LGKLEEIKSLEAQRKSEWRKFLFKDAMVLNCIIYLCLIAIVYCWLKVLFPNWFISADDLYISDRVSEADAYMMAEGRTREAGGIFLMITLLFVFAMGLIKFAFYHTKFLTHYNQVGYYKSYQAFVQKHFLTEYFVYSEDNFPIKVIRDSEIASHDKKVVVATNNRWEMYLSNGYFSGYINGCDALMGHVMCKDTFKNKGKTQVVIIHNSLTISVVLHADLKDDFRLKLEHDKTDKWFGQLFQSSKKGPDELIKLSDKNFEDFFKVYSNSQEAAQDFLTKERMKKIMRWKLILDKKLKITLINNRLTISLPNRRQLLSPKIYKRCTLSRFEDNCLTLQRLFEDLECFNEKSSLAKGHAV
jgi:hypothetical protein